jgi:hypothetical protein
VVIRQMVVLVSLAVGLMLALSLVSHVGTYRNEVRYPLSPPSPAHASRSVTTQSV